MGKLDSKKLPRVMTLVSGQAPRTFGSRFSVFSIAVFGLFVFVKAIDLIIWMDICFRCCPITVKKYCSWVRQSVLWQKDSSIISLSYSLNRTVITQGFKRPFTGQGFSVLTSLSRLPLDCLLLFSKKYWFRQADSKIFLSFFYVPTTTYPQSTLGN